MTEWLKFYEERIVKAEKEIVLKKKAPLRLEPDYEFEKLPEWSDHIAKSHEIAVRGEILKMKAEMADIKNQITNYEKMKGEFDGN